MSWGMAIPAIAQIGSQLLSNRSMSKATDRQNASNMAINQQNIQWARELNNMSREDDATKVRRLVADAKGAGIHPLAALGANLSSGPSYQMPHLQPNQYNPKTYNFGEAAVTLMQQLQAVQDSRARNDALKSEAELNRARKDVILQQAARSVVSRNEQKRNAVQDIGFVDPPQKVLTGPKGGKFRTSPSTPAQEVSDEYGDLVGETLVFVVLVLTQ